MSYELTQERQGSGMCVAVPGRITEINGDFAKVNIMNNITEVNIKLVSAKIGDYVLIHAGCVLEVMKKDVAEEILWMFQELEEDMDEDSSTSNG
ncbi:MAG: HypC/HybG/HupF family hydrogenase formation chaperone [Herbinix sp.]|nr:HypC/HybG/HupF family hydrogenase formation chaperone [Herbinix sp.]